MTASALTNGGGRVVVFLHQIPEDLRYSVAEDLADRWKLKGMDLAMFLLAARSGRTSSGDEVCLEVPSEKAQLVLAGRRPKGLLPEELKIPPVLV